MSFWNCYQGKKVLLTGHTGFKGSWLAIWLKELGAEVYGYSLAPNSSKDNFVTCKLEKELHHFEGDVRNAAKLKAYFQEVKPDIAFHLAAQPLVLLSYLEPAETFATNLMGVVNFFEAVRQTPSVKAAVNITSDKCYDNKEWVWGYRENDPMGGKDPYSASKGCAELITTSYINSFFTGENTCAVATGRAGNVIGGGDWAADRIVPDYFRAVNADEKLVLRNPDATRPWQHVLEPLSGYLTLGAMLFLQGKKYAGGWNFGPLDANNYPVKELIDKLKQMEGSGNYSISENVIQHHEANFLKLDVSKSVSQLKWQPVLNFDETVKFTVEGYQAEKNKEAVLKSRIQQIQDYTKKALDKASWASNPSNSTNL
ncbi:CDP-glucose 4,6-dehydratase [Mucilaginibacter sp. HMF7410]|uniref:CDP-glucose 4,6-dehydratase n=2 Tax=Mucilaginibacter arboris TaxID=2682090 RepID=A0A7K1SUV4_9SPHI|nr:CDP-glucose 4,6-dehydratase [Mucilaginibacter arboris]